MVISTMQSLVNEDHRNMVGNSIHETTNQKKYCNHLQSHVTVDGRNPAPVANYWESYETL